MTVAEKVMEKVTKKRVMAVGVYTPESEVEEIGTNPQIMLVNEKDWVMIAPYVRQSGLMETLSLEHVDCPIVLTTEIKEKGVMQRLIRNFVTIEGVHDMDLFIYRLEQLGGIVQYPAPAI
jgi:hypothetical protein